MQEVAWNHLFCAMLAFCGAISSPSKTATTTPSHLSGYQVDHTYLKQALQADFNHDTQDDTFQVLKNSASGAQAFEFTIAQGQSVYYNVPQGEVFRTFQILHLSQHGTDHIAIQASTLEDTEHCHVFYLEDQHVQRVARPC